VSEYQYHEFRAVERPLSQAEQRELRAISTRAQITAAADARDRGFGLRAMASDDLPHDRRLSDRYRVFTVSLNGPHGTPHRRFRGISCGANDFFVSLA
jgi:hypothetical protein